MADNIVLNTGSGGDTLAADDIGGVKYQIGKIAFGAADSVTQVSSGAPLPCTSVITGSVAVTGTFYQATQPVSLASVPSHAVTNAGTFAVQAASTVADGSNVVEGAVADAIVAAGATGSISAKLRRATQGLEDLKSLVVLAAGSNTIGAVNIASAQTLANVTTVATVTNLAQMNGAAISMGNGASGTGVQRVTLATDSTGIVAPVATTGGGATPYSFLSTGAVLSANIKNDAGNVYAMQFFSNQAAPVYVRLYNQVTAPGSTDNANIVWRGVVPGNTSGAGYVVAFPVGLFFGVGIGIRVTAAVSDTDTSVLTANTILGNVSYK